MYDKSFGRNPSYKAARQNRSRAQKVAVQVESQTCDGLELPCRITWKIQQTFRVDRVFGCRLDPATGDMEYAIRIGTHATKLWKRPDGSYYVIRKR